MRQIDREIESQSETERERERERERDAETIIPIANHLNKGTTNNFDLSKNSKHKLYRTHR